MSNRTQRVRIEGVLSDPLELNTGVPQGTVMGPILFLLYVNHLLDSKYIKGHIISYADDTAIVYQGGSWDEAYLLAETELDKIHQWLSCNLLSLNINKTKFVTFSMTIQDQPARNSIFLHKHSCDQPKNCHCPVVERTDCVRYLGIMVDQYLRWKEQVDFVAKKLKRMMHKFYQLRDILSHKNLKIVYCALVESILRYGVVVWGGVYQETMRNLGVIQNTILKILFKRSRLYSTECLYTELKIMNIRQLYSLCCLLWTFDNKNDTTSASVYSTRFANNLKIDFFRASHLQRFMYYFGPKLYNSLTREIRSVENRNRFQSEVKKFLLANYTKVNELFTQEYV